MSYNHQAIEKKWQDYWDKHKSFKTSNRSNPKKNYILDMFPYPSAEGLHVGHPEGYTATDIISRFMQMRGYNVLHPMGWDAFGLPAEQYAIKTGNDPQPFTKANIQTFKRQLKSLGLAIDWDREITTCDPAYYKWTQWIFTKLYELGLAEIKDIEVNWCEGLQTVLANEEIINVDGKMVSDIGKYPVSKRPMKQWVLKITHYAKRLLDDLELVDWPESVKDMQRNWIGESIGAKIEFSVAGTNEQFTVFTTRADTLFGATYCVLAPEHELVSLITTPQQKQAIDEYITLAKAKSDLDRTELNKEKTGVFTGAYAINPVNQKAMPIWIADYVLSTYGTGAIMAVPAHDTRDYAFAKKFDLAIVQVLESTTQNIEIEAVTEDGLHINSGFIDGLNQEAAINKMVDYLETNKIGEKAVNYRLRDWIFSRQRYWGEPFPVIFWEDGTISLADENELPLELPAAVDLRLSGTGESPLANLESWLSVTRQDGVRGRRETNTMPQWAGSCWYYIAYCLKEDDQIVPLNSEKAKEILKYWLPVDLYIGGTEHAVLHLLYARFWHKVLYDIGIVKTKEPFSRLFNQGMILGTNGVKMSKSLGNVVNPDQCVREFGADALRLAEMFMGPLEATKPWTDQGVEAARRFIDRVYRLYKEVIVIDESSEELTKCYHQTVKKVTEDFENLRFNTAIAQMMIYINECYRVKVSKRAYLEGFIKLLNPITPHITEEIWQSCLGYNSSIASFAWPTYDENKTIDEIVTVVIQVNGKIRDKVEVPIDTDKATLEQMALSSSKIIGILVDLTVRKIIVVPGKLVNIVAN